MLKLHPGLLAMFAGGEESGSDWDSMSEAPRLPAPTAPRGAPAPTRHAQGKAWTNFFKISALFKNLNLVIISVTIALFGLNLANILWQVH